MLQWLFGPMAEIRGIKSAFPDGAEWQYILTGKMENGVLFSLKNSTVALMKNGACFYGEKGYAELPDYWKARKVIFCDHETTQVQEYPCNHELLYEVAHIAECFQKGLLQSPVVTGEFSASAIRVLEKIKASWN